jgi:hypothetical protein
MSSKALTTILGNPTRVDEENSKRKLIYKIEDFDESNFLQYYNMPYYYGEYIIADDVLVSFKFGFPYP